MKEAKYIKNMFYTTLYRTSDDKYKDAIIAFTRVRYVDKSGEEFVTLNKIEDNFCNEVWKDVLSKKISNYESFIKNNNEWKNLGMYKESSNTVKFYEPESVVSEGILDTIDEIEIYSVGDKNDNLSFIILHDSFSEPYCITCSSDDVDIILNKLVINYSKLVDKGKISVINVCETGDISEIDEEELQDDYDDYYWMKEKKNNSKVKIFAGVLALVGIGALILWPNSDNNNSEVIPKQKNTSENDNDVTTADDVIVTTTTGTTVYTTSSSEKSENNVNTTTIITEPTETQTSVTSSKNTTTTNNNVNTTNNDYTITVKPETKYTGTYRTVNSSDMIPSQTGTKHETKSTQSGTVTYRTIDPRDTVTAPSKPGEQVFTKDGATTTTKKASTTVKNPYADLIITNEINSDGKKLVLK